GGRRGGGPPQGRPRPAKAWRTSDGSTASMKTWFHARLRLSSRVSGAAASSYGASCLRSAATHRPAATSRLSFCRACLDTRAGAVKTKNATSGSYAMPHLRTTCRIAILAGTSALAIAASALAAEYKMTVNRDRLINAQNEPQNWLMMNGDYGSMRYSKLTQLNRETVKNLRMVWALALGGMQDVGQNGPEN